MIKNKLNILLNQYLDNSDESDDEIRNYFLEKGEDPDMIINRAADFVKKKESELKLKEGKEKQNKARDILSHFKPVPAETKETEPELSNISYAFRKKSGGLTSDDKRELKLQAQKISELKKQMGR